MPLVDNAWYVNYGNGSTTGYWAKAVWTAGSANGARITHRGAKARIGQSGQ